jgi:hypothetical protein
LILAFLIFIFKAGFYQAEAALLLSQLLPVLGPVAAAARAILEVAVLAGLLAGAAHLTKLDLAGLVLFVIFGLAQAG